jgi:hypothetical protein
MDATQHKGRAEAGAARRREIKRHIVRGKWLQAAPEPFKLGGVDAAADAAGTLA